jgi:hypothetical protein
VNCFGHQVFGHNNFRMAEFVNAESFDRSAIQALVIHVAQKGGRVSENINFVHSQEAGTGIFATASIPARVELVSIPFIECISAESVMTTCLSEIINIRPGLLSYPDELIAMGLMYAATHVNSENNPWIQHVKTIPRTYNTPLYWSEDEFNEIKGTNAYHLTNLMKKQIKADWEALHQPLSLEYPEMLGETTIELYQWALSTVYSRAVGIYRKGVYTRCIPPVVDMANHNPEAGSEAAETFTYDVENDRISLINNTAKKQGDECFAVYGTYPNGKLLYTYGFVINNAPTRAVDLWSRVAASLPNASEKQDILNSHALTKEQTYDFVGTLRPAFISPALLATVRIIQADEAELECAEAAFRGEMLSVRNEKASYISLRNLLLHGMRVDNAMVIF